MSIPGDLDSSRARISYERVIRRTVHLSRCKLVVLKGSQRGREYLISGEVIRIGKAEENDLVLPEETVSRLHCEILRDQKGYLLRDLRSTNGTFLDGAEVREAYVRAGSVITVGMVDLKFQPFEERIEVLPAAAEELGELRGGSLQMREIFGLIEHLAPTDATVLIEGEAGTGKDLVARTIHQLSRRKSAPFVVVDCAATSSLLMESELFGHEKGALTGAQRRRQGAFELASMDRGTIFLDGIDELSLDLQSKLLRVLEQREIRRVGSDRTVKIDVRVLAAAKQDLRKEVQKGKFREDLYFRLSVAPIHLPPLRERREDLPLLVKSFLYKLDEKSGTDPRTIDEVMMNFLAAHDWPGNVRELRDVLEHGAGLSRVAGSGTDLASWTSPSDRVEGEPIGLAFDPSCSYRQHKERWEKEFEKRYLKWLMERAQGNISRAAREADMDRKYLHKLLKKHAMVS